MLCAILFHPNEDSVQCTTFYDKIPFSKASQNTSTEYSAFKLSQLTAAATGKNAKTCHLVLRWYFSVRWIASDFYTYKENPE